MKLVIDLVPKQLHYKNLRSLLSPSDWIGVSRFVRKAADGQCMVCGVTCCSLEAHEVWEYDDKKNTQTLADIRAVCYQCHRCYHLGHSLYVLKLPKSSIIEHLMKVNEVRKELAEALIDEAMFLWETRSHLRIKWEQVIPGSIRVGGTQLLLSRCSDEKDTLFVKIVKDVNHG